MPVATAAQCALTGVTAGQYGNILANPAGQYNVLTGGNQLLTPETAKTWTLGLVMNPIRSLTATVDAWFIKIEDAVGQAPAQTTLNNCLQAGILCGNVQRDALGSLWVLPTGRIVATNQNLGGYYTSGIDVGVNWTTRMGNAGGLGLNFIGTYVDTWKFEPIKGLGFFDCVGLVGQQCGTPNPAWRHKARATWATPMNVDLALTWRFIGEVQNETSQGGKLAGPNPLTDKVLEARHYFDLAASWTINKTFTLRGGVNNILDQDPPIVSGTAAGAVPALADPSIFGNGNTFPQMYDTLGRLMWVNLTMKF